MDTNFDPSFNIFSQRHSALAPFFCPKSVAVIGASDRENSVGRTLMKNLIEGSFPGKIIPINPKRKEVLGEKTYPSVAEVPFSIDLAIIVTPAKTVVDLVKECAQKKIQNVVIISAGFKELGESGEKLEQEILEVARKHKMRVIGPNCLGVMSTFSRLNATFAADMALKGNIAFISQSGALLTAVLDWSLQEKVGFSSIVSIGSMVDVSWGDLIHYFGSDPHTESILLYMESIGNAREFLSAAREVCLTKPIILIKAGRSEESAKAAASHTGSLAGSDAVLNAALERIGVLRVDTISDLFSMASVLAKQVRPKGPNLSIITNAGGPGVIATDALVESGGKLAEISKETLSKLNELLPAHWSRNNPIDILGDASPEVYGKVLEIIEKEENSHGVLVILSPQDMTDPTGSAQKIVEASKGLNKPLLTSWMGGGMVEEGKQKLHQAKIPCFSYPDEACKAFSYLWKYTSNLESLYETPFLSKDIEAVPVREEREEKIQQILSQARKNQREILTEFESKQILDLYGIPTVPTFIAKDPKEAAKKARELGFPVVVKLHSETITHKTEVGGVILNLPSEEKVEKAFLEIQEKMQKLGKEKDFHGITVQPMIQFKDSYELILGSSIDPEFGPTLLFGSGGQLVEVYRDSALALPPLTTTLAKKLMKKTKVFQALQGVRGRKAVSLEKLQELLVRFSNLIAEQRWIAECDINPLLVSAEKMIALDARIVLQREKSPPMAIRPYPINYVNNWSLKNQKEVLIRPILPEDESKIIQFHKELSEDSVLHRYAENLHYDERTLHERMIRICFNDYDLEIALVVQNLSDLEEILAVARLSKVPGSKEGIFYILIKDKWQNQGIGKKLLSSLIEIAKQEKLTVLYAKMLLENKGMQKICKEAGFFLKPEKKWIFASLKLV